MELDRRAALGGLLAAVAGLPGCTFDPPVDRRVPGPKLGQQVDAHCHIFNILDVPSYAYAVDVQQGSQPLGNIAKSLALLLVSMLDGIAPTFADEQQVLTGILAGTIDPAKVPRHSDDSLKLFDRGLRTYIERYSSGSPVLTPDVDVDANDKLLREELVKRFSTIPNDPLVEAAKQPRGLIDKAPAIAAAIKANHGKGDEVADYIFQFLFGWAPVLANYRFQLAADLGAMFQGNAPIQQLLTPATLDIGAWLVDAAKSPQPTPLLEQAELMRLIALIQPANRAVHGLIGFDPAHQIAPQPGTPAALDIVKATVLDKGMIGVKVYPPMGFRATGNAALTDDQFPAWLVKGYPNYGRRLDDALAQLYQWCSDHGVPIMAHCAASQGSAPDYACRAGPQYWGEVLTQFPKLKVNLGHFGGIWQFDDHPIVAGDCSTADWTTPIAELMVKHDGLYADVGDFANVLNRSWDTDLPQIMARLTSLVKTYPVVAQRLMYGTDWQLLDLEPENEVYYTSMRDQMANALGTDFLPGFFRDNALRFFGLAQGGAGHRRLSDFYAKHGKHSWILDAT